MLAISIALNVLKNNLARTGEAQRLCGPLPRDFIGASPDYLTVQCMGHGIKVPVEIFIDRHLFDISAHRCPVAASHSQVSLRRHISCEVDPHCFEPGETIANGQRRKFFPV